MPNKYIKPYSLGNGACAEEVVTHEAPVGVMIRHRTAALSPFWFPPG